MWGLSCLTEVSEVFTGLGSRLDIFSSAVIESKFRKPGFGTRNRAGSKMEKPATATITQSLAVQRIWQSGQETGVIPLEHLHFKPMLNVVCCI